MNDDKTDGDSGAVFGFDDLKALREEYEERIRVMKVEHEERIKSEGASRQELITDLTFELAAAREEGEMRVRSAQARGGSLEAELRAALESLGRIEAEVMRVKLALADALSPTGETRLPLSPALAAFAPSVATPGAAHAPVELPVLGADVVASEPAEVATSTPPMTAPPVPVDPTPASTAAGARRKKIRLR